MSADEIAKAKEDTASRLKELEKKVKTLETELAQAQEVCIVEGGGGFVVGGCGWCIIWKGVMLVRYTFLGTMFDAR